MAYTQPIAIDYDALQNGLAAVFAVACNLPGSSVGAITNIEQAYYFPSSDPADGATLAKITYDISSVKPVGLDEWRIGYDPTVMIPGDTYQPNPSVPSQRLGAAIYSAEGNRLITVQVKCECWDLSGAGAVRYIERIRARLALPSFTQALRDLRCATNSMSSTRCMFYTSDDGRSVDVAQFELLLNAADAAVDSPITTIEKLGKPTFTPVT